MAKSLEELLEESRLVKPHNVVKLKGNALVDWREELESASKKTKKEIQK